MNKYCALTIMALVLAIMPARAAIYMVGNTPFGDWNPAAGIEMTDLGDNTYSLTTSISGTVWFVFADGLTSDWTVFNSTHRYGPTSGGSQDVSLGNTYATQKSDNNHAYKFTGTGLDYTFTFNAADLTFSIAEYEEPVIPDPPTFQVGDVNADGEINIGDVNTLTSIILSGSTDVEMLRRADVNRDGDIGIADLNVLIDYILGGTLPEPVKQGYDYVWDEEVIPEIHITVSLDEWNRLLRLYDANAYTTQYVKASVSFTKQGETTIIDDAGIRLKGNTSRRRPEGGWGEMHQRDNTDWHHAHFGVNLRKYVDDEAHTIQGVRKLHLKWFKDDPAQVREVFCYDLFRRAGVWTAIRDNYCRLWIRVEGDSREAYYGVYGMLEPIDKRYLTDRKERFGASNGFLWKCRNAAAGLNNPDRADIWYDDDTDDRHAYTLETQTAEFDSARVQLIDFMNKINRLSDSEFYTWIQQVTDVDLLLKTYAVNVAVGMWDDYWNNANNYYIYFNSKHLHDYKFFFIPYDYDNTLGTTLRCGNQDDAGRQDPLHWGNDNNRLIARILKFNDFKAKYVVYLKELVKTGNGLMDRTSAQVRIHAWQQQIAPYVSNDTGEDMTIEDRPAPWSNHSEYNLLKISSDNFFTIKAASINTLP